MWFLVSLFSASLSLLLLQLYPVFLTPSHWSPIKFFSCFSSVLSFSILLPPPLLSFFIILFLQISSTPTFTPLFLLMVITSTIQTYFIWTYSTGVKDSFSPSLCHCTSLKEKANLGMKLWISLIAWSNKALSPKSLWDAENQAEVKLSYFIWFLC